MGLFMPLLLGGFAFVGLPWLIHRIRRPTLNPTPFSSLMFVPKTTPPLRERKRIEHPWLMLARMIILAALALAYARPYVLRSAAAAPDERAAREHVLLVDTSLSTNAGARFETLRAVALACLDGVSGTDRVEVVAFSDTPSVLAPLRSPDDSGAGTVRRARQALERLTPTSGATAFIPALQLAEQLLRPAGTEAGVEEEAPERVIHLVSDLQRTGLPSTSTPYTLMRGVTLRLASIPGVESGNLSVEALSLEPHPPSTLLARVRLRNYGDTASEGLLQLRLGGENTAETMVALPADSNTVVPVSIEADLAKPAPGEVSLVVDDVLPADNTRYFVYHPEPEREIGLLLDPSASRSRPVRFLEAAIAESQPLPWTLRPVEAPALLGDMGALPGVIVIPEIDSVAPELAAGIALYVTSGGRLLLIPSPGGIAPGLVEALLAPNGLRVEGPARAAIDPKVYAVMNWIDYSDPVFQAFRGAAYSDFSMVRFQNHHRFVLSPGAAPQVLARLDTGAGAGGDPAVLGFGHGSGRVALWAFPLDPEWTNLTRTRRFIPLLHETIASLLPALEPNREHIAGSKVSIPPALAANREGLRRLLPREENARPVETGDPDSLLAASGFVRWYAGGGDEAALVEPVNLAPVESDLRVFGDEEFLLRVGAVRADEGQAEGAAPEIAENVVHWEYGYYLLIALAATALLESGMAVHYSRQPSRERHAT